jgi:hypothetical protein
MSNITRPMSRPRRTTPPLVTLVNVLETTLLLQENNHWSLAKMHTSKIDAPKRGTTDMRRHHPIRRSGFSPEGIGMSSELHLNDASRTRKSSLSPVPSQAETYVFHLEPTHQDTVPPLIRRETKPSPSGGNEEATPHPLTHQRDHRRHQLQRKIPSLGHRQAPPNGRDARGAIDTCQSWPRLLGYRSVTRENPLPPAAIERRLIFDNVHR